MQETRLTFESKSLVVDWIGFNIQGFVDPEPIANYLFRNFGFKSIIKTQVSNRFKSEWLNRQKENQFQVCFEQYEYNPEFKNFWLGSKINFSGTNADYFYNLVKKGQVDWTIFKEVSLSRFDIHYFRQSTSVDSNQQVKDFMESACNRIREKSKRRKVSFDPTREPYILKVGSRSSSNFYRVYQKTKNINRSVYTESTDGLEFELEVKKDVIKSFQQFLFNNQVEEFEKRLTQHFFNQSKKNFGLNFYYTDWIRDFYRKLSDTREFNASLVTDYIKQTKCDSLDETVFLFRFLQFLSFIRKFEGKRECVDDQVYYIIEFPIVDFLHFLDKDVKSTYQRTKLMEFFKDLQELPPFVEKFSDSEFQSSIMFPLLKLTKQGRSWFLKIAIGEQLYWYSYPFRWTSSLCNFQNKYDLLVKLEIIQVLSTDSLKKKISVEDFLNQFSIPNKKRAEIKKLIIDLLDDLKAFDLIEAGFDIVSKDGKKPEKGVKMLTPSILSQSKEIFLHEIINSNN